jgi:hypothetical protein
MTAISESVSVLPNDPILDTMEDPNIAWGDLFVESIAYPKVESRTAIQKKFPVIVRLQPSKDLGIQWNIHKLSTWRESNPNPLSWKVYETKITLDLVQALEHSGWCVSNPTSSMFLCTIERSNTKSFWKYEERDCPTLLCLNDIKMFFPVIWHNLDKKQYNIELYHDKIEAEAGRRGVSGSRLTNYLANLLHTTLRQSPAWLVRPAILPGEFCRITTL